MSRHMYTQESRFSDIEEVESFATKIELGKYDKNEGCVGGIPVLSDGKTLYVAAEDSNTLVVASPGSGKSRRVAFPLIMADGAAGYSMIINDPKGELYRGTLEYLKKLDYKIYVLNFRNPRTGAQWNPLYYSAQLYKEGNKDVAAETLLQFAEGLFSKVHSERDAFWEVMAANVFLGLGLIACKEMEAADVTLSDVYKIYTEGLKKRGGSGSTTLKQYLEFVEDSMLQDALAGYVNAPSDTKASIEAVFSSCLSRLVTNQSVNDMLSASSFLPEELVQEKVAIFIISRDESQVYNPLISALIDQIYCRLIESAEKHEGILPRRVEFILDEFSNLTKIHFFESKISACRSRNIRFHLFVQSYEQLSHVYGDKIALVILSCCYNTIYLHSPEARMLELISKRCGTYVSEYSNEKRRLLSPSELQHFSKEDGECLLLLGRLHPFVTNLPDKSVYQQCLGIQDAKIRELPERELKIPRSFSLYQKVRELRERRIEEMLSRPVTDEKTVSTQDVDEKLNAIVKRMEERMAEVNKEE